MEIKVAYQGVPGAYSEKATRQLLGAHAQVVALGFPSFDAAHQAVDRGDVDFGVLPIENSLGGSIHANYDLLLKVGLRIVGEYDLRVEHSLLALPGVQKSDIKTVISHPQALAQCAHTIEAMGATARAEYDTAGSAKMLADNQWKDTAAVASDLAAEYYGLQVLERNVEDDAGNFTRFLLLAKNDDAATAASRPSDAADAEFKTSLVFSFMDTNEKGQLYKALSAFSLRDIDLAKIESRPWGYSAAQQILGQDYASGTADASPDFSDAPPLEDRRKYKYLFYVDIIGHQTDENVVNALRHLREFCKFVRVLGSYPTKGRLLGDVRKKLEAVGAYPPTSPALTASAPAVSPRLNVGIYGFGNFGQFLTKTIAKYHNVRATSRTDYAQVAQSLGATYYSSEDQLEAFFKDLDVLVLCVSILSFEKVAQKIPKALLEKLVVIDVLSVKTHPKQILLRELPASSSILCTHPMFGPESGKYSWRGLNMMYEKVRVVEPDHAHAMAQFLRVFESELCRMLEMTCEAHDEFAASSQFLTHLTGRILSVQGVKNTPIDTRGFKNLVRLVEDTCKDSFDLFQGLYEFNPNSESQIQKFEDSLKEVTQKLKLTTGVTTTIKSVVANEPETMAEKYPLNPLLGKVSAAKTVVIHGITKQLEAEGKNVYSLCVGEPDFLPDPRVLEAGKQGFASGNVKYTDVKGTIELRKGIADYLDRCKGVKYNPQTEILVSNGAKQSVFQSLLAVCKPGEKVLIPSPYWVSYPAMVKLVNAEPVVLRTTIEEQYLINPEALERTLAAHPEIKVMIFCNPSNPSGTLHSPEHLERIAAVLRKPAFRHVLVIADEIYEQLVYQEPGVAKREHQTFASLPGMYERTLLINGFSKSHAMPGLRVGYLAAPKYFVDVCTKLQGQFTSCASSIGQHVATAAMQLEMECVDRGEQRILGSLEGLDKKRQYVLQRLQQIPKLRYAHPTSAFYVFLDLAQYFEAHKVSTDEGKPLASADDFCEYLLLKFHVALVPGSAFGEVHGLRISYASSMDTIENAMNGLQNALASLKLEACSSTSQPQIKVGDAMNRPVSDAGATLNGTTNVVANEPETMAEKYPLNPLLGKVSAAKTVVIHGITKQLEAEGKNVYSLCVGEPDFLPDPRVLEAGKQGFASGNVKYTDVKGTIELRKGIADYLDRCKGVKYNPQTEILVSNGAKQSVFQSLLAVCKPGEKVLIPSPYWVSYPAMVKLVNAEPVVLRTTIEEQYLINPEALERTLAAHPEIKVMIFCNPSNPSGTLHSPEHLERIAAVLRKPAFRHVLVIADEIYEQLVYQEPGVAKREHQTFASLPGMYERTLLINGFSKSHAMPGLRVGYLAAPKYFVDVCTKLQGQFTSCASSIGQHVATAAMQLEMECVDRGEQRILGSLEGLDKKRQYVLQRLQQIPKLRYAHPTSAFYVFLDLAQYFEAHKVSTDEGKPLASADDFCEYLLLKFHVALVPGSAFGEVHGLRISYASSMDTIENAMNGLQNALASLKVE